MVISVIYERTLEVEDWLTASVCQHYGDNDASLCQIQESIFTVGALDNIDHHLPSTTARGSFY